MEARAVEPTRSTASGQTTRTDTVIAGAGPAGLAVGACLRRKGCRFVILEKSDRVAAKWHQHYERLHLHTDKDHSELPYLSYPDHYPRYPSRQQVIEYLSQYARHFDLSPRFNQPVVSAEPRDGRWHVYTPDHLYLSRHLVVATGYNNVPHIPDWPGRDSFAGRMLHSSEYDNGEPLRGKKVLVVGFGNSGGEIAIDLCEYGAEVALSVRSPVNIIPRDLLGFPILAIAIPMTSLPPRLADALTAPILRLVIGDIRRLGLEPQEAGPFTQIERTQRIPLIDVGTVGLIEDGQIEVCPGIERFAEREVVFADGSRGRFDAVVLATGYRPGLGTFLKGVSPDIEEHPLPCCAERDDLFFCGFYVSPAGMLREIALEARQIAEEIDREKVR